MPLPTGQISMSEVNVELGFSSTAQISMGDTALRALAGVASGAIGLNNLQGKANSYAHTITSNQNNLSLRDYMLANGWNGSSAATITVTSGVTISANSTGSYAMTISGSFPGGLTLINNGAIQGMGGAGGNGGYFPPDFTNLIPPGSGGAGGPGLLVQSAVSINNAGRIAGGGGGGCGGNSFSASKGDYWGGGGGGGGQSGATNSSGGVGGGSGFLPATTTYGAYAESGFAGTVSSAGAGGRGATFADPNNTIRTDGKGQAGSGGSWGASGGSAQAYDTIGNVSGSTAGAAGGAALAGNSNITWIATGTRLGAIT